MEKKIAKLFPEYGKTTIKIVDYIRKNPACSFDDIADGLKDTGRTPQQLRGNLVSVLRNNVIFADPTGPMKWRRPSSVYYLTMDTESAFEDADIDYEV